MGKQGISHRQHGLVHQKRLPWETARSGGGRQLDLDMGWIRKPEGLHHYLVKSNLTKEFPTDTPTATGIHRRRTSICFSSSMKTVGNSVPFAIAAS